MLRRAPSEGDKQEGRGYKIELSEQVPSPPESPIGGGDKGLVFRASNLLNSIPPPPPGRGEGQKQVLSHKTSRNSNSLAGNPSGFLKGIPPDNEMSPYFQYNLTTNLRSRRLNSPLV